MFSKSGKSKLGHCPENLSPPPPRGLNYETVLSIGKCLQGTELGWPIKPVHPNLFPESFHGSYELVHCPLKNGEERRETSAHVVRNMPEEV